MDQFFPSRTTNYKKSFRILKFQIIIGLNDLENRKCNFHPDSLKSKNKLPVLNILFLPKTMEIRWTSFRYTVAQ